MAANIYVPEGMGRIKVDSTTTLETLEMYKDNGDIVEGFSFKCDENHNMYINIGKNAIGIIPKDEFEYSPTNKETKLAGIITRIGKLVAFKIIGIESNVDESDNVSTNGKVIVHLSRKQAQKECFENYISKLQPGEIIEANKCYIDSYGIFCDVACGISTLLLFQNMCTTRILNPQQELKNKGKVYLVIKGTDEEGRLLVSHKELLGTWNEECAKFKEGETVIGKISNITDYGIFVELTHNLVGLTEISQDLTVGDNIIVFIKSINPNKMKIKLAIISDKCEAVSNCINNNSFDYKFTSGRIKEWQYSPEESERVIKTVFY